VTARVAIWVDRANGDRSMVSSRRPEFVVDVLAKALDMLDQVPDVTRIHVTAPGGSWQWVRS